MKILVVPDTHARKGESLERFTWLSKLHKDQKFDAQVHLGDLWDFPSLCSHDANLTEWHMRNIQVDYKAGNEQLLRLEGIGKKKYFCFGNHEARLDRFLGENGRLAGLIPDDYLSGQLEDSGFSHREFLAPLQLNGLVFQHYFVSGVMGRPVGGTHRAHQTIAATMQSAVQGHSHTFDYKELTTSTGKKIQSLVAGCFVDPRLKFDFAKGTQHLWWNGVCILHVTGNGTYDLERWSYERLKSVYS